MINYALVQLYLSVIETLSLPYAHFKYVANVTWTAFGLKIAQLALSVSLVLGPPSVSNAHCGSLTLGLPLVSNGTCDHVTMGSLYNNLSYVKSL
jgi:hypothetical protein